MKILTVVGNRPQFVKSAPLGEAFREAGLEEVVVHTGQHWDDELSRVFFEELGLAEPAHRLDLRTPDLHAMTAPIRAVIDAESPDLVLVLGDTNSTLAGARAAAAEGVPIAHVEAGLRSGDLSMPEERARMEVDTLAALLLCPDERSAATLRDEGVPGRTAVVGDVMADATLRFAPIARERVPPPHSPGTYVVATVHREANVRPERLRRIVQGLSQLDETVVLPAHPRTASVLETELIPLGENVELREPLGYLAFASAASQARVIATDSGGLQKEAYWYRVPCVTMRPSTEWVDTVVVGANLLVDDDPDALVAAVGSARFPAEAPPLYGDGHAAGRIASVLGSL
ncbi:MAG TPA: UDP-N-acetylglucosamine 2-epimerase (non-hydrolyzing) [Gaiella sp.]|uniref:non-hydrolyzing UDP-N-acetylglucosamine 2-epimerase n=1 Tax=Gaiella sp. TaxID=2663207 RepID=UPI002D7EA18A|nr:UDP-N-acetylglucosamine 2-epimerase (non-hydrolyzing) [Gaiella sp.]HET9286016.1 UDP-N-acetylglucosamine 2-epimerase (non-hydrolyzing) [Gaiella sp.]